MIASGRSDASRDGCRRSGKCEVSLFKRPLKANGPHFAIDDDPATVWRGKGHERASFWFHQLTLARLTITGCAAAGKVRAFLWEGSGGTGSDGPWTDVMVEPRKPAEVTLSTRVFDVLQVEPLTALCVASVEVVGEPKKPGKPTDILFSSTARLGIIYREGKRCSWGEREPPIDFVGTCLLEDSRWALKGEAQHPDGRCWMPGSPYDKPGAECAKTPFEATWPVTRVNRCMVIVDGRSFGREACW